MNGKIQMISPFRSIVDTGTLTPMTNNRALIGIAQAAEILGLSTSTVRVNPELYPPAMLTPGGRRRYDAGDVERWRRAADGHGRSRLDPPVTSESATAASKRPYDVPWPANAFAADPSMHVVDAATLSHAVDSDRLARGFETFAEDLDIWDGLLWDGLL